jgi:hypothetical protein
MPSGKDKKRADSGSAWNGPAAGVDARAEVACRPRSKTSGSSVEDRSAACRSATGTIVIQAIGVSRATWAWVRDVRARAGSGRHSENDATRARAQQRFAHALRRPPRRGSIGS